MFVSNYVNPLVQTISLKDRLTPDWQPELVISDISYISDKLGIGLIQLTTKKNSDLL